MKTATLPAVRVEPELRQQVEAVLGEHESLSQFVEQAVREGVSRRLAQEAFIARGLAALEAARQTQDYVSADEVARSLQARLDAARARQQGTPPSA